jgi:hypothetical protein
MKISLLAIVLTISLVGSPMESLRTVRAVCPLGDLSGNCEVDLPDMLVFAGQWLDADSSRVGMVAHWKLDGNAADLIGGNHGTVHGNPVWTIGQLDGALYFDGVGDYVDCGNDSSLNLTNNFSISAWFNLNDAGQVLPLCKGNVPAWVSGGAYSILCVPTNGILAFYVRDSNNTEYGYATTAVPLNEWTHIVGTFSDGNVIVYKNGSFADDDDLGTSTINSNDGSLAIGAEGDGGMPFKGMIDDVRIYDRALNEVEVQDVAKFGIPDPNYADLDDDGSVNLFDFTLLAKNWQKQGNPLVINEFMASNSSDINDLQGDHDDWFEIYNTGSITVDIGGMYLTDDLNDPTMWRIPDDSPGDTTIGPYGYLIIWADKDMPDGPLHVDFKLDGDGDEIGLFDTDGNTLVDSIVFGDQVSDISYGRYPDAGDTWRFMGLTTPEAQNSAGYLGQVADTEFSHDRGFYVEDFNVTITCDTPDVTIRYTMNGSTPSGGQGNEYFFVIPIETTTCLRAMAFKPGWLPSNVDTQTYIFLDDVIRQSNNPDGFHATDPAYDWGHAGPDYEMDPDVVAQDGSDLFGGIYAATIKDDLKAVPTLSLVMNVDDWFKSDSDPAVGGIYANPAWEDIYQEDAERVVSVELIDPCGLEEFQINAVVRLAGGSSTSPWKMDKLSMRLKFQGAYGPPRLRFPLFGDEATDVFDTLVLDARMNNSWPYGGGVLLPDGSRPWVSGRPTQRDVAQYTRDQFVSDIQNAMGGYGTYGRHVHLYLNGLYWGLYWVHERPDEHFAADYFGGDDDDYYVLKHNSSNIVHPDSVEDPSGAQAAGNDYNTMFGIANAGLASDAQYQLIQQYLDVPNLIDYMITNFYVGNTDWAHHNWYATRSSVDPAGRWRYHSWDAEHSMEALSQDVTGKDNSTGPTRLHQKLRDNTEYRMLFADHVHRYFFNNGLLTIDGATALYTKRLNEVDRAVVGESARWGDNRSSTPYTRDIYWVRERDWLLDTYLQQRSDIVLDDIKDRGLYPTTVNAPVFSQHGGPVPNGFDLTMSGSSGTIWYTIDGNDPRLPASGQGSSTTLVAEDDAKRVLVPTGDIGDTWRGGQPFDDSGWNHGTPSIPGKTGGVGYDDNPTYDPYITYDVTAEMDGQNDTCYIRIPFTFNGDPDDFDFMTLRVRYDDGFVTYLNGVKIHEVLAPDPPQWDSSATNNHSDSLAVNFQDFSVTAYIDDLEQGDNILAIHGLNAATNRSDFLISVELIAGEGGTAGGVSDSAIEYIPPTPVTLTGSTHIKARVLDGSTWSALNEATFAVGPVVDNLRITEMMYHPLDTNSPDDPNAEFIELTNIGPETINLSLVSFTEGIHYTFPSLELTSGEFVLLVKDRAVFDFRYTGVPPAVDILSQYEGRLANGGERIRLEDAIGRKILDFEYRDGFSLNIIDPTNSDSNSWGEKDSWRASDYVGGSPGKDTDVLPNPGAVVINEVMAHSHGTAPDWIELYNTTGAAIDISGWYLSDNDANLKKYRIADGTTIAGSGPNRYMVFYEDDHFGDGNKPGCYIPFAFSENGEEVCLSSAESDVLTGYREVEDFGASERGISFGRYFKSSTGNYNFVAMDHDTPDGLNADPKVGPIVINEIMYHPDWPDSGSYNNDDYEYIELHNITGSPVTLYDFNADEPWKFTDGIEFTCPNSSPVLLRYLPMVICWWLRTRKRLAGCIRLYP